MDEEYLGGKVDNLQKVSSLFHYYTEKESYDENHEFYGSEQEGPQEEREASIDVGRCQLFLAVVGYYKNCLHMGRRRK